VEASESGDCYSCEIYRLMDKIGDVGKSLMEKVPAVITGIQPKELIEALEQTIVISGSNLGTSGVIEINGTKYYATWSETKIEFKVTLKPGVYNIVVKPDKKVSMNAGQITVKPLPPTFVPSP